MPCDEEWFETLMRRWPSLAPDVRLQLQLYMSLAPRDRKNQRRLEKKLKTAVARLETGQHGTAESKSHS